MLEHKDVLSSLRKALAHIDDPAYLERLPYLEQLAPSSDGRHLSRGQSIQRTLRVAIDRLAPNTDSHNALDAQAYEALYQYTLSHRNMTGIAMRLGMSERQAYRLLNRAIDALASELLQIHADHETQDQQNTTTQSPEDHVQRELERLVAEDVQRVDMIELLHQVLADVGPLARDLDISLEIELGQKQLFVIANRVLLRQATLNLVSYVLSCTAPGLPIRIIVEQKRTKAHIRVIYNGHCPEPGSDPQRPLSIAERILDLVHITYTYHTAEDQIQEIMLELPVASSGTILIVDDNEDLIALFRRYLRDQPLRVYGAESYEQARQALLEYEPDTVILDIMLPKRDGWELLRMLRASGPGYQPKVIVCSIINDPELSSSLGADAFLNKPVSKRQLIETVYAVRSTLT